MINWKAVVIGFILAIVFTLILNQIIGSWSSYIGIIMAGIIVGYMVNQSLMNGLIHGGLIGILGGIAAIIIILTVGGGVYLIGTFGLFVMGAVIADVILGAIGGTIGYMLTKKGI